VLLIYSFNKEKALKILKELEKNIHLKDLPHKKKIILVLFNKHQKKLLIFIDKIKRANIINYLKNQWMISSKIRYKLVPMLKMYLKENKLIKILHKEN